MNNNRGNERGSILMLVVLFIVVMTLVGFAIMYMNSLEYMQVRRQILNTRAALLADAGLDLGRGFLYYCDARLEDQADMKLANGGSWSSCIRKTAQHDMEHDGVYKLYTKKKIDGASPEAWCDVWVEAAADNMHSANAVYEYVIRSKGTASFGFHGCLDAVKEEEMKIKISSITVSDTSVDPRYSAWPVCFWPSCRSYHGGHKDTKHLPGHAMNMGMNHNPPDYVGYETRYYFDYVRDSGRAYSEDPTKQVVH